MPRPTRIQIDGALCYVTSRATEGGRLFTDARDYDAYLRLLAAYREQFGFKLFAFALLPDQVHLCVELAQGTTISAVMHALNSRYTKHVTKRHGRMAHVFQERFKLTVAEKAPSLLRITGYLHRLPQRSGLAESVQAYSWSSASSYLAAGASRPGLCLGGEVSEVLEQLRRERPGWTYERYLQGVPEAEWQAVGLELERPAVGSEEFVALVDRKRRQAIQPVEAVPAELPAAYAVESPATGGRWAPAMTFSVALAAVALVAVVFFAKNIDVLRQTVRVLSQENQQTLAALGAAVRGLGSGVRLASWSAPRGLAGTSWDVRLRPVLAAPSEAPLSDRIQFEKDQMVSAILREGGFTAGRYTSTPKPAGDTAWESVQVGPGGEMVSWQGQQSGRSVSGIMTRQRPGKPAETFRFIGVHRSTPQDETTET